MVWRSLPHMCKTSRYSAARRNHQGTGVSCIPAKKANKQTNKQQGRSISLSSQRTPAISPAPGGTRKPPSPQAGARLLVLVLVWHDRPADPSAHSGLSRTTLFKLSKNSFRISKKENEELRPAPALSARESLPDTDRPSSSFKTWFPHRAHTVPLTPSFGPRQPAPAQSAVGEERETLKVLCSRTQASPGHAPQTDSHTRARRGK